MTAAPSFVFVYPEEAALAGPEALAAHVAELGFGGIAVALAYHRGRCVLPRYGRVVVCAPGHIAFVPERARYGALVPGCTVGTDDVRAVHALRAACADRGLRFHAWLVVLHHEGLVAALPEASAQMLDGTPTGFALCPSHPESRAYDAALVADVGAQFAPDVVELEAASFPAWEPAYTLTLTLDPVAPVAARLGAQCMCRSCRAGIAAAGEDPDELTHLAKTAAGPPFAAVPPAAAAHDDDLEGRLATLRARLLAPLIEGAAASAHAAGATLRPTAFGDAATVALQGISPVSLAAADGLLVGLAADSGDALLERFAALRALAGALPTAVSTNWSPQREPAALAADVRALRAAGADAVALYNLTLAPEAALPAFAAAARALHPTPSEAR